jgi:two-component system cell cycle sensor histidine kinase/response regulator CckA
LYDIDCQRIKAFLGKTVGVEPMPPEDIYTRAFENAQTGVLLLERASGRILEANPAFLRLSGRARTEIVGRSFWSPPLVADPDAGAEMYQHLCAGGTITGSKLPLEVADGRCVLLEVNGAAANGLIQLEVRDVTGHEQARMTGRIEVQGLLAARTAVEFQQVHRALRMTGELLLIGAGQGRPVLDELEEIQQASQRASGIAEQLLAFSGGIALQLRPVPLNALVEDLLPRLRQLLGPDIEIVTELTPDAAPVMADPIQMRQVMLKLAANSKEAIGGCGCFRIETRNAAATEPDLGNTQSSGGPYGMLVVSDSGSGFDDQSWAHLYEPFFSTKASGLGLGLAAVHGVVRQSGGHLWAFSQPGDGATFRIYLPLAGPHSPALPAPALNRPPETVTILLIEANDGMRAVMANLLKKRGYRVLAALDSKEALRAAKAQTPPDLLIGRPEPELASRLARMQPQLRILYLEGYVDSLFTHDHGRGLGTATLRKPFEPDALLSAVEVLLSQPL